MSHSSFNALRFPISFISCMLLSVSFMDCILAESKWKVTKESKYSEDNALFLTPFIKKGQIRVAQERAIVQPFLPGIESFAGYLTVNETTESNLFFWLFKSQLKSWKKQPVMLFFEGAMTSAMMAVFRTIGPYRIDKEMKLTKTKFPWTQRCNLLFIDSPVGTGFSFTNSDAGYSKDTAGIARDMYEALLQLYTLFPNFQRTQLIFHGESHGGKHAIATAHRIFKNNESSKSKLPLASITLSSPFMDPINTLKLSSLIYHLGLVDERRQKELENMEDDIRALIRASRFAEASDHYIALRAKIVSLTGLENFNDILHDSKYDKAPFIQFINDNKTRSAIHAGNMTFDFINLKASSNLKNNFMKSVRPRLEELLATEKFPVLITTGGLELTSAYPLSDEVFHALQWPRAEEYHAAERCQFRIGQEVVGYYKTAGSFTEMMIRKTGHVMSLTQPKTAFTVIDKFITNSSSFVCNA